MTTTSSEQPSVDLAIHTLEPDHALPTADRLAARREQIVNALREGANAGSRLAVFPEGAIGCPGKAVISRSAPELDEADWSKADWHALRLELGSIAAAARELNLWWSSVPHTS